MCAIVCGVRRHACPGTLAGTSLASPPRGDNFNLNKWPGGRHLCPRLVLFILDYSVRTCAAVSSAGRVRCLLSRVNVFQDPPGIYLVWYLTVVPTGLTLSRAVLSDSLVSQRPLSVFALIYAITTRDAFSSSPRKCIFVILCPAELAFTRAANCGNGVGSLVRFSRQIIVVSLAGVRNVKSRGINQFAEY